MSTRSTALTVVNEGRDPEEAGVDEERVDEACAHIRGLLEKTVFKGMTEVGAYVLDRFFAGKPEDARSHNPKKSASYRALVERCDSPMLPIGRAWLHGAVNLAIRDRELDGQSEAYDQLTPTHKLQLLPISDSKKVVRLAERAVKQGLTTRALHELVVEEREKEPKDPRGRKPRNAILKALDGATRTFTLDGTRRSFRKTDVTALADEEARAALKAARALIAKLEDLASKLEERVEG